MRIFQILVAISPTGASGPLLPFVRQATSYTIGTKNDSRAKRTELMISNFNWDKNTV